MCHIQPWSARRPQSCVCGTKVHLWTLHCSARVAADMGHASSQPFPGSHGVGRCRKATDEERKRTESMRRHRLFSPGVLPVLLLAVVTGCAPVTVQQTTLKNTYTDVRADVLTTGELSQMTQQVLRMQGLHAEAQEPARAFHDLEARSTREPNDDQQVALVELALWNALRTESSNPTTAADWYVLTAARSYDFLFAKTPESPLFDLRFERMRFFYLRAVAGLLQSLRSPTGAFAAQQRTVFGQAYMVEIASGPGLMDPNTFDELLFAAEMNFEGL